MLWFAPFQSTPSVWRVTLHSFFVCSVTAISIHTLRVEGDSQSTFILTGTTTISIHTLRVEGDTNIYKSYARPIISFHTLRVEGDIICLKIKTNKTVISIHTLRVEGDKECLFYSKI